MQHQRSYQGGVRPNKIFFDPGNQRRQSLPQADRDTKNSSEKIPRGNAPAQCAQQSHFVSRPDAIISFIILCTSLLILDPSRWSIRTWRARPGCPALRGGLNSNYDQSYCSTRSRGHPRIMTRHAPIPPPWQGCYRPNRFLLIIQISRTSFSCFLCPGFPL